MLLFIASFKVIIIYLFIYLFIYVLIYLFFLFSFAEITNIAFIDNGILMLQVIYKLNLEIPDLTVLPVTF